MIVIESNSRQFPTSPWTKGKDDVVVTVKWPTTNTDYLAGRHISHRRGNDYPFLCYKWNPPREGKFADVSTKNIWQADWEKWDKHYRSFGDVKHPDPSSGACAVYSVYERWQPDEIGLIGFDYVLDNNTDWMHDACAELASMQALVSIIDLRTPRWEERNRPMNGVNHGNCIGGCEEHPDQNKGQHHITD